MSDEELPSTSREAHAEAEEVKRKREVTYIICLQTDMKNRMQKFTVHLRLGGTEHGGKAEFSSHLQSFRCLLLCAQEHVFLCGF